MTKHSSSSSSASKCTTTKKCKKPCASSSSSSCCTDQCIDCCTTQFQRLNRFSSFITYAQLKTPVLETAGSVTWPVVVNENDGVPAALKDRCGITIRPPNTAASGNGGPTGAWNTVANAVSFVTFVSGSDPNLNGSLLPRGTTTGDYLVAASAYYFVNEFAYGPYEPGCHNDQVYGWYVNVLTGNLQLFAPYEGVPVNVIRANLLGLTGGAITSQQKSQLKVLNKLYKLSKSAIKEIDGVPSQEGNIVEVCDCKGQRWLLFIDSANSQNGSALLCNYEFAVVATKLC